MAKSSDEFSEIVAKVLSDNTAQSVLNHLKALESNRDRVRARWVWELLQNARDASADSDMELVACIEQSEDELVFEHNGESFSLEEIAHLIYHGSTKTEDEETIGQYGSGFLTTHLLSPEISVSGRITDGRCFAFRMRREISSVSDLSQSMRDAERKFEDSLSRKSTNGDLTTKFQYPLSNDVLEVVEAGIESLKKCAPFVLVFNRNFSSINIQTPDGSTSFTVTERTPLENVNLEQIAVLETENENQEIREYLLAYDDETSIAIPVKCDETGQRCLPIHDTPRLFLGFPMIGTENFSFPAVINSFRFTPTENRDGVYLGQDNNQTNTDNQTVIETAGELLIKLLGFTASFRWENVYLLVEFPSIQPQNWINQDWLRNYLKESLIPEIRKTPAILSEIGAIAAEKSFIPFAEQEMEDKGVEDIWDLLSEIAYFQQNLPHRSEAVGWCNAVESWAHIIECKVVELDEIIDGSELISYIEKNSKDDQEYGNLMNLQKLLREGVIAVDWMSRFLEFVITYGFQDIMRTRSIIPDQSGFLYKISMLHRDKNISEELKDIADSLDWPIRKELRDTRFTALKEEAGAGDRDDDYVIKELVSKLQDRAANNPDALFAKESVRLFSWIVKHKIWILLNGFPVFALESDGDNRRIIRLDNNIQEDARPLSPVSTWVEGLHKFSDLFPGRHTLANEFFESTPDPAVWRTLDEKGFLRTDVVITEDIPVRSSMFLPDEHLTDDEDHRTLEHITITSVAFMTKDDVGIMARVRQSRNRARLFWRFITEWLVPRDLNNLHIREGSCICKKSHRYYPAYWLVPLKKNKWIPRGERRAEPVTAQSLANLLRNDEWNFYPLNNSRAITRLLEAIDVSRFDLMRELFVPNNDARAAIDSIFMNMLEAAGGNVDRLSQAHRYLEYLRADPDVHQIVAERQDHIRQVQENNKLGAHVEDLVKQCLEKKEFMVRRTGNGSDFEIEYDSAEAGDVMRLELKRLERTWLVEVKATRGQEVRMTTAQAKTAESEGDRFLLCVVPIPSGVSESELNIEDTMVFVADMGPRVAPLCHNLANLRQLREDVISDESQGVRLEVEAGVARIRVAATVWQDCGFPLAELSDRLK